MTNRERVDAVLHFKSVDSIPNVEIGYWDDTLVRWRKEGLPASIPAYAAKGDRRYTRHSKELTGYFHMEAHDIAYNVSLSDEPYPSPDSEVVEEDGDTVTIRYSNGYVIKCLKSNTGIFNELDWPVKSHQDWEIIRKSYVPGWHRISADSANELPSEERDFAVALSLPGFFWELRKWLGFEKACTLFYDDPDWAVEMLEFWSNYLLSQCKLILETGFKPEFVMVDEDMAYNHGPMISPIILKKFIVPQYQKINAYLYAKGIDVVGIESDGLVDEMIPIFHDAGVNLWSPFEMICRKEKPSLLELGEKYPWLRMIGGMDKTALVKGREAIVNEVSKISPLAARGGYIPTIDHKVPPEVSLENYELYLYEKSKRLVLHGGAGD